MSKEIYYTLGKWWAWQPRDISGNPIPWGKIYTYKSTDHSTPKETYQDREGKVPHTNPIRLDANGRVSNIDNIQSPGQGHSGAIYFKIDPNNPADRYYIVIKDKDDVELNIDIDNYPDDNEINALIDTSGFKNQNYTINSQFDCDPFRLGKSEVYPSSDVDANLVILNNFEFATGWFYNVQGGFPSPASQGATSIEFYPSSITATASCKGVNLVRISCINSTPGITKRSIYQVYSPGDGFGSKVMTFAFCAKSNTVEKTITLSYLQGDDTAPTKVKDFEVGTDFDRYYATVEIKPYDGAGVDAKDFMWIVDLPKEGNFELDLTSFDIYEGGKEREYIPPPKPEDISLCSNSKSESCCTRTAEIVRSFAEASTFDGRAVPAVGAAFSASQHYKLYETMRKAGHTSAPPDKYSVASHAGNKVTVQVNGVAKLVPNVVGDSIPWTQTGNNPDKFEFTFPSSVNHDTQIILTGFDYTPSGAPSALNNTYTFVFFDPTLNNQRIDVANPGESVVVVPNTGNPANDFAAAVDNINMLTVTPYIAPVAGEGVWILD